MLDRREREREVNEGIRIEMFKRAF